MIGAALSRSSSAIEATRRSFIASLSAVAALSFARRGKADSLETGLKYPIASVVDATGAVYVADLLLPGVWRIEDGKVTVFHKADKKYRNPLFHPRSIAALEKGSLLATDTAARDIFLVKSGEAPKGLTGGKFDVPAAILQIENDLYVADTQRNEIWKGALEGKWSKWADVPAPRGLALGNGKKILAISGRDKVLYSLSPSDGKPEKLASGEANGYWTAVAIGKDGVPVVVDSYAKTLWRIDSGKPIAWVNGEPFDHPVHITRSGDDFLVTDSRAKALIEVTPEGKTRVLELTAS
jgi:hypothetical protein